VLEFSTSLRGIFDVGHAWFFLFFQAVYLQL